MNVGYFSDQRKGDIMSKITSDVMVVQFCITNTLQVAFREPFLIIGYCVLMVNISWQLTVFSILYLPIVGLLIGTIVKRLRHPAQRGQERMGDMVSVMEESLSGVKAVKSYNAFSYIRAKFRAINAEMSNILISMARKQQLASPMSEFLGITAISVVLVFGGSLVQSGALMASGFVAYIAAFSQLTRPLRAFIDQFANINQGIAAGERVFSIMDAQSGVQDKADAVELKEFKDKIEFRAVGSSANCAASIIALNSAVAHQLNLFKKDVDSLIEQGIGKDEAIFQTLKKLIIESKPVRFEGDGYSQEWRDEAMRRGLTNITSAPEAISKYLSEQSKEVLIGEGIFDERELASRVEVEYEKFSKKVQIESRVLGDLAINHIVPTAVAYQNRLIDNLCGLKKLFDESEFDVLSADRKDLIKEISSHVTNIKRLVREMTEARKNANILEHEQDKALAYDKNVRPIMSAIRTHIDALELVIDNSMWPLPKYREILFSR